MSDLNNLFTQKNEYFIHDLLNPRADGKFGDILSPTKSFSGASQQNSCPMVN